MDLKNSLDLKITSLGKDLNSDLLILNGSLKGSLMRLRVEHEEMMLKLS